MAKVTGQVLEDNGGGIHWVTTDGRSCSSDRPTDGALREDIESLYTWIDNARHDRPDEADMVSINEDGMTLIAQVFDDGDVEIYDEHMGRAASDYAGLTDR